MTSLPSKSARPGGIAPYSRSAALAVLLALGGYATARGEGAADDGWQPLFDGRSLSGWTVFDARYWSVEDGAIVGRITREVPCTRNQYLVWGGGDLADFELKLRVRLRGEGGINNGFQFRSRLLPDHDVCGYQVDNNLQTPWLVRLYDEYGRHTLAMRGERTVFDAQARKSTTPLEEAVGDAWFRLEDWHEYHLACVGPRLTLRVDGRLAAEVFDHDPQRRDSQGVLALQLHSGPPTVVEFRDIRLRLLAPAEPRPAPAPAPAPALRDALRRSALAWWPLDEGGHGAVPALRHHPDWDRFELNTAAVGPGARPDARVLLLDGAHLDAGDGVRTEGGSFTVYLRARAGDAGWRGGLLGRGATRKPTPFLLRAESGGDGRESVILLEAATDQGTAQAAHSLRGAEAEAWTDLVGRYDGATLTLFLDGTPKASTPLAGKPVQHAGPFLVGATSSPGGKATDLFAGALETAAVWARALGDDEIRALSGLTPGVRRP